MTHQTALQTEKNSAYFEILSYLNLMFDQWTFVSGTSVMGLEKFGQSAWIKKEERLSNYSNEDLKECVVCCCKMARNTTTTLTCKHVFHTHVSTESL